MVKYNNDTLTVELDRCNPNGVVAAQAGYFLFRNGREFWLINPAQVRTRIEVSIKSFAHKSRNQPWYESYNSNDKYTFANQFEIWYKESGTDNFGWKFISFSKM